MRRFTFQSSDPKTPERPVPSAEGRSDANGSVVTLDWLRFLVVTFEEKKKLFCVDEPMTGVQRKHGKKTVSCCCFLLASAGYFALPAVALSHARVRQAPSLDH